MDKELKELIPNTAVDCLHALRSSANSYCAHNPSQCDYNKALAEVIENELTKPTNRFYTIWVTTGEFSGSDKFISVNKKDCEARIMEFSDWYCPNGTCRIRELDENFHELRRWQYYKGKLITK